MAVVTKTIGTASRDYSTITAWEAASYGATGSDNAVGEGYNDSAFDEAVAINDATPIDVLFTAAVGEEHDGTIGTGVSITGSGGGAGGARFNIDNVAKTTVSFLENTYHGRNASGIRYAFGVGTSGPSPSNKHVIKNCIGNPATLLTSAVGPIITIRDNISFLNNIFMGYDFRFNVSGGNSTDVDVLNNTIMTNGSLDGLSYPNTGSVKNNIVVDATSDYSGTVPAGTDYNLSSDATASGGNSLINKTSTDQFVSTVAGSEDLHLKSGADAIDAGTDLGTTPSGVEIDIDGWNRDSDTPSRDPWDMGAHEFLAAGGNEARTALATGGNLSLHRSTLRTGGAL